MRHHPHRVVLEDVAVVHPLAWTIIGSQAILVWLFRGTLTVSFHATSGGVLPFS